MERIGIMGAAIEDYLNPFKIWCRQRGIGLPKGFAVFIWRINNRSLLKNLFP